MRTKSKLTSTARNRRRRESAVNRLGFEKLEDRKLLAGLAFESVVLAGADNASAFPRSAVVDSSGNTYMVGYVTGTVDFDLNNSNPGDTDIVSARGYSDGFIAKYGPSNEFLWVRTVGGDSPETVTDFIKNVELDAAGNVYVSGEFDDLADFGPFTIQSQGDSDGFAAKLNASGNFEWVKTWGGVESNRVAGMTVSDQGQMTVAGYVRPSTGATEPQLLGAELHQFDSAGIVQWSQFLPSEGEWITSLHKIEIASTPTGELVVAGSFIGTMDLDAGTSEYLVSGSIDALNTYVMQLSSSGEFQWANSHTVDTVSNPGSRAWLSDLAVSDDGSVALISHTTGNVNVDAGGTGYAVDSGLTEKRLFTKYTSTGQFEVATMHDDDPAFSSNLTSVGDGYYVLGALVSSQPFEPAPGISLPPSGATGIFVMEIDGNGNAISAIAIDGPGNELFHDIRTDPNGNLLVVGSSSSSTIDFDPDPINTSMHSNPGFADAFVLTLRPLSPGDPITVFGDSFEVSEWNGNWVEDSQNDWFRSTQRSTEGLRSAEVDGRATNATLTMANTVDLSAFVSAQLTFDWLIESEFDRGEYLSLDISTDGGANWQNDVRRLSGNVNAENVWHRESIDLLAFASSNLLIRYRSSVSGSSEDANVDNVRIVGIQADLGPNVDPVAAAGGPYSMNEGSSVTLNGSGSFDADGSIVSYAWDLDQDGQFDDGNGTTANFSTKQSGSYVVGLQVTDNRGATAETTAFVSVSNVAPTANAGGAQSGILGTPIGLSAIASFDPGNDIVSYAWDLDDDGLFDDAFGMDAQFSTSAVGSHSIAVQVTDADGASSIDSATITVSDIPNEVVLFEDSFEVGSNNNDWNGKWEEDSQNDYFRSTQRSTDGVRSAEVDGYAGNATLTLSTPINVQGYNSVVLTFDWLIENGFDSGEYLALDISSNGGTTWQSDVRRLSGNVDAENTWHSETVDLTELSSSSLLIRFRSLVSSSREDANIDNVKIVASNPGWATLAYSGFDSDSLKPIANGKRFSPSTVPTELPGVSGAVDDQSLSIVKRTNELEKFRPRVSARDKVFANFGESGDSSFGTLMTSPFFDSLETGF